MSQERCPNAIPSPNQQCRGQKQNNHSMMKGAIENLRHSTLSNAEPNRQLPVPDSIDADRTTGTLEKGLLRIRR